MTLVVNGRFYASQHRTGLHRVAAGLVEGGRRQGLPLTTFGPPAAGHAVDRVVWGPPGRLGDHLWEQVALPRAAGRRPVLSLANTAPVMARRGVVTVHDLATLVHPEWFRPELRVYGGLTIRAARRAEVVVTVSAQVAGELAAAGVRADRIGVVRPAIDPAFSAAPPDMVEAAIVRFGIRPPFLLHVGWPDPRKGVDVALAAHVRLLERCRHELVLVGWTHRNFAPVAVEPRSTVHVLRDVDDDALRSLMTGATALVYPTRYEGFGLPPLEAIACGTPALVSDIPALRESVGGAGVFLPPGDIDAWIEAMASSLAGCLPSPATPTWTWADAGAQLCEVLSDVTAVV